MKDNLASGKEEAAKKTIALVLKFTSQMQANSKIINVVTRVESKAFDKVLHEGLRYEIHTQYQLPSLTIKLLSNFLK